MGRELSEQALSALEKAKQVVIYHGGCDDGFGAAWVARRALGKEAFYLAATHGDDLPPVTKAHEVFVLDFSYPRDKMLKLQDMAGSVLVLDHHQTAYDALHDLPCCHFDMNHSGVMLAWQHFFPNEEPLHFVKLLEDQDLNKFNYPETAAVAAAIRTYPYDFELWTDFSKKTSKLAGEGKVLVRHQAQQVQALARAARSISIDGKDGLIVNASVSVVNGLGNFLAKQVGSFAIIWSDVGNKIKCSVRSVDGYDSSWLSLRYGGGGHGASSSFMLQDMTEFERVSREEWYIGDRRSMQKLLESRGIKTQYSLQKIPEEALKKIIEAM